MNSRRDEIETGADRSSRSRRTRAAFATSAVLALAGIALYAAAGLWIAPRVVERELRTLAREEAGLDLAAETVAVNPFTLTLSVDNVTLFRDENTPAASVGRLEGRIGGIDPGERSLVLRGVVIRSLAVFDRGGKPLLAVPRATAGRLVLGAAKAPLALGGPALERPNLQLRPGSGGLLDLHAILALLLAIPPADGDAQMTFDVSGASVAFGADPAVPLQRRLGNIDGSIGRRTAGGAVIANASLRSRTPGIGRVRLTAEWLSPRPRERTRMELALDGFDLSVVSPWLASLFGAPPQSGHADGEMRLEIDDSVLHLDTAMRLENLRFAPSAKNAGAAALPEAGRQRDVATALALLEDTEGRITLDVPLVRRRLTDRTGVIGLLASSMTDYLASLTASPFDYLAGLVEWPGSHLGSLGFEAGSAEIGDETAAKIAAIERVLTLRPLLALTVFPALDERADREALARQQIRLHVNLASSAGIPGEPAPETLDYDDPVVRDVLEEFAANRLAPSRRQALTERHPGSGVPYYRAVFEALVEEEDVAMPTLLRLARFRAQAVARALSAGGDGSDRIRLAEEIVLAVPARGPEVTLEVRPPSLQAPASRATHQSPAVRAPTAFVVSPMHRFRPSGTRRR